MYQPDPFRAPVASSRHRSAHPLRAIAGAIRWEFVIGFLILIGFFMVVLWLDDPRWRTPGTVGLVLVGWVFSVCLHEFGHAATAYLAGDHSDGTVSYLSFDPRHYLHPVLSVLLPVLFIIMGGLPLPGGAVYLRRDLVRSRVWQSAISLAGPAMSLLVALLIAVPFLLVPETLGAHPVLEDALAFLAFLEIGAVLFNLLPLPPLDGYGVISPWLPQDIQQGAMAFANYGILLIFVLFVAVPGMSVFFFETVYRILIPLQIDPFAAFTGYSIFRFWQQ
ncbi:MAG: site-2 protease family protein [Ktedonobacterales bacterium]